ncbi:acyltransferase family protein [Orrella sp. 11846]|uniref:acyltransferase family protein n=1 Tax=Orrella sp. 11846 TaxID=3409913 RepID=UPI003B58EF4B
MESLKGLLIFLVVLGHFLEPFLTRPEIARLYKFIYAFHMPAFVFLSGLFARAASTSEAWRMVKPLLLIFLTFAIAYECVHYLLFREMSQYAHQLAPYWILWYLVSLACWRLVAPTVRALPYAVVSVTVFSLAVLSTPFVGYPFSLARTFTFLPFFVVGILYGNDLLRLGACGRFPTFIAGALLMLLVFWTSQMFSFQLLWGSVSLVRLSPDLSQSLLERVVLYGVSFAGIVALLWIVNIALPVLSRWGANSLSVYAWHGLVVMVVKARFSPDASSMSAVELIGILAVVSACLCFIFSSYQVTRMMTALFYSKSKPMP